MEIHTKVTQIHTKAMELLAKVKNASESHGKYTTSNGTASKSNRNASKSDGNASKNHGNATEWKSDRQHYFQLLFAAANGVTGLAIWLGHATQYACARPLKALHNTIHKVHFADLHSASLEQAAKAATMLTRK